MAKSKLRKENFVAVKNTFLLSFRNDTFLEIMEKYPDIKENIKITIKKRKGHQNYVLTGFELYSNI